MKRIRTVHPSTIVGSTLYHFVAVDDRFFEGDVPDDVFEILMKAKKPIGKSGLTDWSLAPVVQAVEPKVEEVPVAIEPEIMPTEPEPVDETEWVHKKKGKK